MHPKEKLLHRTRSPLKYRAILRSAERPFETIEKDRVRSIEKFESPSLILLASICRKHGPSTRASRWRRPSTFPYTKKPPSKLLRGGFSVIRRLVMSFPTIPALVDQPRTLCRVRGRVGNPRLRHVFAAREDHPLRRDNNPVVAARTAHSRLPDRVANRYSHRSDRRMHNMRWNRNPMLDTNNPNSSNTGHRTRKRCASGCASTSLDHAIQICNF